MFSVIHVLVLLLYWVHCVKNVYHNYFCTAEQFRQSTDQCIQRNWTNGRQVKPTKNDCCKSVWGLILMEYRFQTTFHYLNYLYINQKCEHNFETGKWRWGKTLLMELVNIGSLKYPSF